MNTHPWIVEQQIIARTEELHRAAGTHHRIYGRPSPRSARVSTMALARSPARLARAATWHLGQTLIRVGTRLTGTDRAAAPRDFRRSASVN